MGKRLLMQSDDYGITDGVSAGIRSAIRFGLIRNTGLFVNMDATKDAAEKIMDLDVCLGIDINYVCGQPVSNPGDVPHMVDENGHFFSSGVMSKKSRFVGMDGLGLVSSFEDDPYPYEEVLLETRNQVERFIELTGKKPEYMHLHSLTTDNCYRAAMAVAKEYDIIHSTEMMRRFRLLPGTFDGANGDTLAAQMAYDVAGNLLDNALPTMQDDETCYFICHCGYVDYELFSNTTLTLRRARDLYAMQDERVKTYLRDAGIELITYRDL